MNARQPPWKKKVIPRLLALEPRVLFDGAAAVTAVAPAEKPVASSDAINALEPSASPSAVATSEQFSLGNTPLDQYVTPDLQTLLEPVAVTVTDAIAEIKFGSLILDPAASLSESAETALSKALSEVDAQLASYASSDRFLSVLENAFGNAATLSSPAEVIE